MEGKGWFLIYGILLLFTIYLALAQHSQGQELAALRAQIARQQSEAPPSEAPSPEPTDEATDSPQPSDGTADTGPDLSSPAARDTQRKQDVGNIKQALKAYYADTKKYPTDMAVLVPKYLSVLPKDPLSPKYSYRYVKVGAGFRLTAVLENKNDPEDRKGDGKQDGIYTVTATSP